MKKLLLIAVMAAITFSGACPSAYAKHGPKPPKIHKMKKNASPYAYLKPKKQKRAKGYYRSTLTGQMVYGKAPK